MEWFDRIPDVTPLRGATVYAVLGGLWILFSDQLVFVFAPNRQILTFIQTVKGVIFVASSTLLIYGLTMAQHLQRQELTQQIRTELNHVSVLHRILRHNVRNQCNVILGYLDSIEKYIPEEDLNAVEAIRRAVDRLLTLSEKASRLNKEVSEGSVTTQFLDIKPLIVEAVESTTSRYPDAHISVDMPDERVKAVVPDAFDWIIKELLENAIEHNDQLTPRVDISVRSTAEGVILTIADNGPGLPPVEREVMSMDPETPLQHSQGIGLWVVRILTMLADGSWNIVEEADGTTIELTFSKLDSSQRNYPQ